VTVVFSVVPTSPPAGFGPVKVALCCSEPNVKLTVPPALITTQPGEKVFDVDDAVTPALEAGLPPANVTVTPVDVIEPELAVTVDEPTATPVALVDVPVVVDRFTAVPVGFQLIVAPGTAVPCAVRAWAVKSTEPHGAIVGLVVGDVMTTLAT